MLSLSMINAFISLKLLLLFKFKVYTYIIVCIVNTFRNYIYFVFTLSLFTVLSLVYIINTDFGTSSNIITVIIVVVGFV